jgi:hypothetical protein
MTITGGCRCGAIHYKIDAERITARHCWCRDCQYIGAGSGTVNVFFPSEAVEVEGALSDYTSRAASGNLMHLRSGKRKYLPYADWAGHDPKRTYDPRRVKRAM